ncbi:GNAT family N-acetyltransferase [Streptomyces sp. NBC_00287]|uniref:GNAT family N-acetyltransferase n=1 Tax=Streptomyces sp. NBC_00287 TaxID=2975702 RepID=UPI002E2875ED|nr:GNAT family N-acetyltransferase [Streptomyces sp. NBC_00287]
MDPVTLTTDRLLLRTVGPYDTDAVYRAVQDPDIQRWTTIPSPYLPEHARSFTEQLVPDGWADGTMFTFGVFLPEGEDLVPEGEDLVGMLGLTMRALGVAEIGFWTAKEHRGKGYTSEAVLTAARWSFTAASIDRVEWRAEVGNTASRAVAERTGFTIEGTMRSAINNKGVRRDCWVGSLLPSDLALPSTAPYLPARNQSA